MLLLHRKIVDDGKIYDYQLIKALDKNKEKRVFDLSSSH